MSAYHEMKVHNAKVAPRGTGARDGVQVRREGATIWVSIQDESGTDTATAFFATAEDFQRFATRVAVVANELSKDKEP